MRRSLRLIKEFSLENVIQGHGGVLLRGEIEGTVDASTDYLDTLENKVGAIVKAGLPQSELESVTLESCGKSPMPLGGLVTRLHQANVEYLYAEMMAQRKGRR